MAASQILTAVGDPWFMDSIVNIFSDNLTIIVSNQLLPDTGSELIVRVLDSTELFVVREWCMPGDGINGTVETAALK